MVLFIQKPIKYLAKPRVSDDQEIWAIEATGEIFTKYEDYLHRMDFYKQKGFVCELTGTTGLTYFDALRSETNKLDNLDDEFPHALREPILRRVQFSQIPRIDNLVDHLFEEFRLDFYPGENVTVKLIDGERLTGQIREKSKFPELISAHGILERKAFARYFVRLTDGSGQEALVDEERITRDRASFTKQKLRLFIKSTVSREQRNHGPWIVKPSIAEQYRITTQIPSHLKNENLKAQKKTYLSARRHDFDGDIMNLYSSLGRLPALKPKASKAKNVMEESARLEYQRALSGNPNFIRVPQNIGPHLLDQYGGEQFVMPMNNGYPPIAAKAVSRPQAPPTIKYPIEDLELPPLNDGKHRPPLKYLSEDTPIPNFVSEGIGSGIFMESVGPLLETWNTLNVYCEVFQLDSFTFDDYIEALQFSSDEIQCELLIEIHCAVLKRLVSDSNEKTGHVLVPLPELTTEDSEDVSRAPSVEPTPPPEPEVKRTTRSSFAKSEAAELEASAKAQQAFIIDGKIHRAAEIDQSDGPNNWIMRTRKRDFGEGKWIVILVGLLNQLSGSPRLKKSCDEVLSHLAPLDREAVPETAISQYSSLNINLRVKALQIICMLSLDTKAIRAYMDECTAQMTEQRKERIEVQRNRKAAVEELQVLEDERRVLEPENVPTSPHPELDGLGNLKMDIDDEVEANQDQVVESEDEEPHKGRSLRRANDRALQRKKRQGEEKERKSKAAAEKAKKPSKQTRELEKIVKKIEAVKEKIRTYEEEVIALENGLRESDCPRTRVLGKDRFWNRYYWMERNAMPYAGLPDSSTADAGYANGCLWVQGPDDMERVGFIELNEAENNLYKQVFHMGVPDRKMLEEGATHVFTARQWAYYDDPEQVDELIRWLDAKGAREMKLKKDLQGQREKICFHMEKRKEYLSKENDKKSEPTEPVTRVSTRTKTYFDQSGYRCLAWKNTTAIEENGHLHSEPKPPSYNKKTAKATQKSVEPEGRQTRATNKSTKGPSRQGTRYDF